MGTTVPDEMTVFTGADGRIFFAEGGAIRGRAWTDVKRGVFGAIIVSALSNSPIPPPREVVRGAEAYAYFHRLPDMAEALQKSARRF